MRAEEALSVTDEVEALVNRELAHHPWTGNVRELRACVGNVLTTRRYVPERLEPAGQLASALVALGLTLAEIEQLSARAMVAKTGDLAEAAKIAGVDRRTLKRILET